MNDVRVGVHHIDGPSMYVMKIRVEDTILRLSRQDASTMASALIHDVNECGKDVRTERKQWYISRDKLTVTIDRAAILTRRLDENWGPTSWQSLAVKLMEFGG